jgi:hypothetical protein
MWIAILGVSAVALVGVYACCIVASDADDAMEKSEDNNVNRV